LTFESEAIENIAAGFRAREGYSFVDEDHFEEIFGVAEPGRDFSLYAHNRSRRA
jgi:hypothetical protein